MHIYVVICVLLGVHFHNSKQLQFVYIGKAVVQLREHMNHAV